MLPESLDDLGKLARPDHVHHRKQWMSLLLTPHERRMRSKSWAFAVGSEFDSPAQPEKASQSRFQPMRSFSRVAQPKLLASEFT